MPLGRIDPDAPPRAHRCSSRPGPAQAVALAVAVVALAGGVLGACGGGGGQSQIDRSDDAACRLLDRLADSASSVAEVDVADPDAFTTALDTAVLEYVTTVDALVDAAPPSLSDELEEMRDLVEQHRFAEAAEARVPVDDWAAAACPDRS